MKTRPVPGIRKDGEEFLADAAISKIDFGGHEAVAVILEDNSERQRAEATIEHTEERYRKIFDHSNDAIFVIDPVHDQILDVNPKACDLLGYTKEQLTGMSVSSIHPNEMPQMMAFADSVFTNGSGWTNELTCYTSDGRYLPSEISASRVDLGDGAGMIAMIRDISERKLAEQAMKENAILEERTRLAREIHDSIAQGLAGIVWQLNVMQKFVGRDPEKVGESVRAVRDLARDTLREARTSVWDLRIGPLQGRSLSDALREETGKAVRPGLAAVTFDVDGEGKVLQPGTEAALLRVCQEALANAYKHAKATHIAVNLSYSDGAIVLEISDDGVGFDVNLDRGFGDASGGFGLLGMKERIGLLGGELNIASSIDEGTRVTAQLRIA